MHIKYCLKDRFSSFFSRTKARTDVFYHFFKCPLRRIKVKQEFKSGLTKRSDLKLAECIMKRLGLFKACSGLKIQAARKYSLLLVNCMGSLSSSTSLCILELNIFHTLTCMRETKTFPLFLLPASLSFKQCSLKRNVFRNGK